MTTTSTRAEHLEWYKQRARAYLEIGDYSQAVASMCSDLRKHPETEGSFEFAAWLMSSVTDVASAREFVEGFN